MSRASVVDYFGASSIIHCCPQVTPLRLRNTQAPHQSKHAA